MQKIFVEKPYQFVRPVMNDRMARWMNNRLIHVPLLRFGEQVVSVQCCGVEKLRRSLQQQHAVMLVPNHPQTSDPVIMYDLMRRVGSPMFAMASWHLFDQSWFHSSVIRLYGGFSVNREGRDKTAINFSISTLQNNRRPLLIFPEGATTRTNDSMMPFLDGPSFIARTAARRRSKKGKKTFVFPVAIRYQYLERFDSVFHRLMNRVEETFGLTNRFGLDPQSRLVEALEAFLSMVAKEHTVEAPEFETHVVRRCHRLADILLSEAELRHHEFVSSDNVTNRIRNLRAKIFPEIVANGPTRDAKKDHLWHDLKRTYRAWQLSSYPDRYFQNEISNQRQIELASKLYEDMFDQPPNCGLRSAEIRVCDPIEVHAEKYRGESDDPLIIEVRKRIKDELELNSK